MVRAGPTNGTFMTNITNRLTGTIVLFALSACTATVDGEPSSDQSGQSTLASSWIYPLQAQYIPRGATPSAKAFKEIGYGVPNPNLLGWSSCYRAKMSSLTHSGVDWIAYTDNRTKSWAVGKKAYQAPPAYEAISTTTPGVVGVYAVHDGTVVAVDPIVASNPWDQGASIAIRHELSPGEQAALAEAGFDDVEAIYSIYAHVMPTTAIAALKTDQTLEVKKGEAIGILFDNPGYVTADGTARHNDLLYFEMRIDYGQSLWAEPCSGHLAPAFVRNTADLETYGYLEPKSTLGFLAQASP